MAVWEVLIKAHWNGKQFPWTIQASFIQQMFPKHRLLMSPHLKAVDEHFLPSFTDGSEKLSKPHNKYVGSGPGILIKTYSFLKTTSLSWPEHISFLEVP